MRTTRLLTPALIACATMTAACVTRAPVSAEPPRLSLPAAATATCLLDVLPANPTQADLEATYRARGAALVLCDGARRLAVETLLEERRLNDRWRELERPKPWWQISCVEQGFSKAGVAGWSSAGVARNAVSARPISGLT